MQRRQIDSGFGDIHHLESCEWSETRRGSRDFQDKLALDLTYLTVTEGSKYSYFALDVIYKLFLSSTCTQAFRYQGQQGGEGPQTDPSTLWIYES